MQILLVEDNNTIAKGLKYSLEQNGYKMLHSENIKNALIDIKENVFDLVILDISLPDGNGFKLYEEEIKRYNIPTIFLTANDEEDDIVKGLELGADDYITKPFRVRELIARINKILNNKNRNVIINVKDISFDLDKMEVYKENKIIELTSLELKILHLLFINMNKVVKRDYIIEKVWEWTGNDINDNTVTVYMKRIRSKIQTDIILTIKGIGYRIDNEK